MTVRGIEMDRLLVALLLMMASMAHADLYSQSSGGGSGSSTSSAQTGVRPHNTQSASAIEHPTPAQFYKSQLDYMGSMHSASSGSVSLKHLATQRGGAGQSGYGIGHPGVSGTSNYSGSSYPSSSYSSGYPGSTSMSSSAGMHSYGSYGSSH